MNSATFKINLEFMSIKQLKIQYNIFVYFFIFFLSYKKMVTRFKE